MFWTAGAILFSALISLVSLRFGRQCRVRLLCGAFVAGFLGTVGVAVALINGNLAFFYYGLLLITVTALLAPLLALSIYRHNRPRYWLPREDQVTSD